MKRFFELLSVSILASFVTFGVLYYTADKTPLTSEIGSAPSANYNLRPVSSLIENPDFIEAAEHTIDAVVHVKNVTIARQHRSVLDFYFGNSPSEPRKAIQGIGSGVIISPNGYIITNFHVIKGASEIEITLNNNSSYTAKIIGEVPEFDLALLKIEEEDLPFLSFADSEEIKVGEWVLAIGNPFNLTSTVTAGIVSAKGRDFNSSKGVFQSFIQTDAAVNPGNSGGALVNTRGELVGINTAISSQTGSFIGYSFAIPSNQAKKIAEDLMEYGSVRKALLGLTGQEVNAQIAKQLGVSVTQGIYITEIDENSNAYEEGLRNGDIITQLDQHQVRKLADLSSYIATKSPGDVVDVTFYRKNKLNTTKVELSKFEVYLIEELGIEVKNTTQKQLKQFKASSGVQINRVTSPRLRAENLTGLLITKIDDVSVNSIQDVQRIIEENPMHNAIKVSFVFPNGRERTYIFR
jgi:Do/DeqQ family serine protease